MINKKIKLIVEKTHTGFSGYSNDYPIFTTGKTIEELTNNAFEALDLFFNKDNVNLTIIFEYK